MRELRFFLTFDIFPTWTDSERGRFSWSPHYSSRLWIVVPPFWIPMKMSLTSFVYMAHWLAYRTSGLEQGTRPLFFRVLSSIQTPRRNPLPMWKSKKLTVKKRQQQQAKTKTKKATAAHLFLTRDAPAVTSSKKTPNLHFWHTINVPVHEKTMKIYSLY